MSQRVLILDAGFACPAPVFPRLGGCEIKLHLLLLAMVLKSSPAAPRVAFGCMLSLLESLADVLVESSFLSLIFGWYVRWRVKPRV